MNNVYRLPNKNLIEMTCDDYLEVLWNEMDGIHELIGEQYWGNGIDIEALFDYFIFRAQRDKVVLTDLNKWDYDDALGECYQSCWDKGLS